ncbi:GyrI-like domain-containing protein [Methanobrevibacter sp. OttesenSCG-928-K11]|nr:GyrI-like domain-containing protein [Methanobrevibacter sp. OttesenSCG-928-K11]MDL2270576.1 GyrI-like domain-containing protein [Methanobrevibacter sp. OttesenSCG-928-I08]
MISKIDFKKEFKEIYSPSKKEVSFVNVPKFKYLTIDGEGDPNTSQEYSDSIEALMSVSFKTKFIMKKEFNKDYVVMPLQGLWWQEDMENFSVDDKSSWKCTSLIMQPDFVNENHIKQATEETILKKDLPSIDKLEFREIEEGLVAQILHIGPFSEEGPTVQKLHDEIFDNDYKFNGLHHEIYLSDIRRANPDKLRTIIRQPIK